MPVHLQWRPTPPILLAVYTGVLTDDEYHAMCNERRRMLEAGPENTVLLVNMQHMEAVSFPEIVELCDNVLTHPKVRQTLIVLKETVYHRLAPSINHAAGPRLVVHFFQDFDAALTQAEALLTPPANP